MLVIIWALIWVLVEIGANRILTAYAPLVNILLTPISTRTQISAHIITNIRNNTLILLKFDTLTLTTLSINLINLLIQQPAKSSIVVRKIKNKSS